MAKTGGAGGSPRDPVCFSRTGRRGYDVDLQTVSRARLHCPRTMPAGGLPCTGSYPDGAWEKPSITGQACPCFRRAGRPLCSLIVTPKDGRDGAETMSGQFEVFPAPEGGYRFRLVDAFGKT